MLAEKTFGQMTACRLKTAIRNFKNIYYIGAVILDSPFYDLSGKAYRHSPDLGKRLHGKTDFNLFHHLGRMLTSFGETAPESMWAFVAGILTHIHTDITFHPFVFYFSGNKDNAGPKIRRVADTRHRKLEAFLDLHFLDESRLVNRGRLSASLRQMEISRNILLKYINRLYYLNAVRIGHVEKILKFHATIQGLFRNRGIKFCLAGLKRLPGINLEATAASFYPVYKKIDAPFFSSRIVFKHPVTGIPYRESVDALEGKTVAENLKIFSELDGCLNKPTIQSVLSSYTGVSLETGLPRSEDNEMKHFDLSEPIEKLVWRQSIIIDRKGASW